MNQCLKRYASESPYSEFPVICGRDFVGVVLETGARVKPEYSKGTSVMGIIAPYKNGTHAEYIVVDESCVNIKNEIIIFVLSYSNNTLYFSFLDYQKT